MNKLHPDWLVPDWPAPQGVHAVFTTRAGGVSPAPWDSMNLGDHVGDDAARVAANRKLLAEATGATSVFMKQVHGRHVVTIDAGMADGMEADACVTADRQVACTMMVADCLPVLLTTADGAVVAAAHAGWRGLAGQAAHHPHRPAGVLEAIFKSFDALAHALNAPAATENVADAMAWLGPCIGPSAFEVGAEVKAAFEAGHPQAARFFKPVAGGKFLCDLAGLARHRLEQLGVRHIFGNDGSPQWCTVSNGSRFYSHRRDTASNAGSAVGSGGIRTTGRMAACIWRA